jgi:predicted Fe-Mo cluster-binding NifX family protein
VVDGDTQACQAHTHSAAVTPGESGIQAAQFAAVHQVPAAISDAFCPHTFQVLPVTGIAMHLYGDCRTVCQALGALWSRSAPAGRRANERRHGEGRRGTAAQS